MRQSPLAAVTMSFMYNKTHSKVIIGIIVVCILVFIAGLLMPVRVGDEANAPGESSHPGDQFLPWQIETTADGSIRVFGLTLGKSTLQEANELYHHGAEVSLFVSPEGQYKVEAYFDKVVLGGFSAQIILVIALSQDQLADMFQRGIRVSSLGGGRKKATLAPQDLQTVYNSSVTTLTYLTRARLDDELLIKRFGEPAKRIEEPETHTVHWLYPKKGLDIALSEKGRAVLQYVPPKQFSELMAPLMVNSKKKQESQ